jgi:hypothetical protein
MELAGNPNLIEPNLHHSWQYYDPTTTDLLEYNNGVWGLSTETIDVSDTPPQSDPWYVRAGGGVFEFGQGVLDFAESIPETGKDALAKLADMGTMGVATFGKLTGWYDIGYTCWSSTCRQYEAGVSQSELLAQSSVVIPLVRQGRAAASGDLRAAGNLFGVAALGAALGPEAESAPVRTIWSESLERTSPMTRTYRLVGERGKTLYEGETEDVLATRDRHAREKGGDWRGMQISSDPFAKPQGLALEQMLIEESAPILNREPGSFYKLGVEFSPDEMGIYTPTTKFSTMSLLNPRVYPWARGRAWARSSWSR